MREARRPDSGRRGVPWWPLALGLCLLVFSADRAQSAVTTVGVVNINTASVEELQLLPGVGPARAQAILAERKKRVRFNRIEDLASVRGIGDSMLDALRPHTVLVGPTTARQVTRRRPKGALDAKD